MTLFILISKKKINIFWLVCLSVITISGYADITRYPMTDTELSKLPRFCTVWLKGSEAQVMKLGIPNVHHVCKGLNSLNKAIIKNDKSEYGSLKTVIGELTYVLDHGSGKGKWPYKGYVYYSRGKAYDMMGKIEKAIPDYYSAISESPKVAPPYVALIDIYLKTNDKEKALSVLQSGLKGNPKSTSLLKRKKKLGL